MFKTLFFALFALTSKPAPTVAQLRSIAKPPTGCKYVKPALIGREVYL